MNGRSLTVKWVGTLLLSSMIGVILVGLFAYNTTVSEYDQLRIEQAGDAFVEDAAAYYATNQTWDGFTNWLIENKLPQMASSRHFIPPQMFVVIDAQGDVLAGMEPFVSEPFNRDQFERSLPIMLDGNQIGTALLAAPPPQLDPREQRYLDNTTRALLLGAGGASAIAVLIGLLLSRHFLRPLHDLTRAIAAMEQGNLNQQVRVRGSDELGTLAQTFNRMSAELHRANQLRKQMTADIAHDLRTPLMVITGYLEALRDGTFQPTTARFEVMYQEAVLLKRLIEDLRTLSLADAGELKLIYQAIAPSELLTQVRESFQPLAEEQQIRLALDAPPTLPPIQIDRERMAQVLGNLISNALRYTPPEGSITLRARAYESGVQLTVSDTGTGIPADQLPNIFERFYRTEESRYQTQGESGLGLAIAKSIVEAHKGVIYAQSQPGSGTAIFIDLPGQGKLVSSV